MRGADVKKAREALGWTRPQLVGQCGDAFTVAQLARMETSGPRPDEEDLLKRVLKNALGAVVVKGAPPPSLADEDADEVSLEEWCGLERGDVVRLADDPKVRAKYIFIRYYRNPVQEYVMLQAPNKTHRPVRPERVLRLVRGKWVNAKESVT